MSRRRGKGRTWIKRLERLRQRMTAVIAELAERVKQAITAATTDALRGEYRTTVLPIPRPAFSWPYDDTNQPNDDDPDEWADPLDDPFDEDIEHLPPSPPPGNHSRWNAALAAGVNAAGWYLTVGPGLRNPLAAAAIGLAVAVAHWAAPDAIALAAAVLTLPS